MKTTLDRILLWTPRVLGILFIAFISLFALDVFSEYKGWEVILALLMHLRWSIVLLIALILAWRWEWIGALGFIAFGVWYLTAVHGFDTGTYMLLAGMPILIGVIFLIRWFYRKKTLTWRQ
jgi:hypothetical protein